MFIKCEVHGIAFDDEEGKSMCPQCADERSRDKLILDTPTQPIEKIKKKGTVYSNDSLGLQLYNLMCHVAGYEPERVKSLSVHFHCEKALTFEVEFTVTEDHVEKVIKGIDPKLLERINCNG